MPSLTPRIDKLDGYNNLILNGNFDLWQRGFAPTVTNSNALFFLADRWRVQNTMTSNIQVERSTDVPTLAQSGFQSVYSMKLTNSASPSAPTTNFANIRYTFEGYDFEPLYAQNCRISFWVKSSVTGTYTVRLTNNDGTRTYLTNITISAANTWEKKTIDLTMDTTGTWLFDNGAGLRLLINLTAPVANQSSTLNSWFTDTNTAFTSTTQTIWASTASATFQIAQVSMVAGSFTANDDLPFKRAGKTIQQELAMCQRYYEKSYDLADAPGTNTTNGALLFRGGSDNGPNMGGTIMFKVTKRSSSYTPTLWRTTGEQGSWIYSQSAGSTFTTMNTQFASICSISVYGAVPTAWAAANIYGQWTISDEI